MPPSPTLGNGNAKPADAASYFQVYLPITIACQPIPTYHAVAIVGRSEVCNKVTVDVGTVSGMLAR